MWWRAAGVVGALLLVAMVGVGWRFGPAASVALGLALPNAPSWLARDPGQVVRKDVTISAAPGPLRADVYRPPRISERIVLVHGLSRLGRRQPDLERLARLLAGHGLLVVVPQFEGLARFRLSGREVEEIAAALRFTRALGPNGNGSVSIAGFSFGAGPALIAAADAQPLRAVGSFGGYADLRDVIAFVTTGAYHWNGQRFARRQEDYNRWKLLALLVGIVSDGAQQQRLADIAERKLANPGDDTTALESGLDRQGRAILALVLNRREDAVASLVAALPEAAREALAHLSPLSSVPRIRARLIVAHGMADDSIPYTESLRLAAAAPDAHLALFETFHHTGPGAFWRSVASGARDGVKLVGVADELLGRRRASRPRRRRASRQPPGVDANLPPGQAPSLALVAIREPQVARAEIPGAVAPAASAWLATSRVTAGEVGPCGGRAAR